MIYVPPELRHKINYNHKNLSLKPKQILIDYSKQKSKEEVFEIYRKENYGKADLAWDN